MPITQSRFLRLIQAGEAYQTLYSTLHRRIAARLTMNADPETKLQLISADLASCPAFPQAYSILVEERTLYQATHRRNESENRRRARRQMEIERGWPNMGLPGRPPGTRNAPPEPRTPNPLLHEPAPPPSIQHLFDDDDLPTWLTQEPILLQPVPQPGTNTTGPLSTYDPDLDEKLQSGINPFEKE